MLMHELQLTDNDQYILQYLLTLVDKRFIKTLLLKCNPKSN